jgi:hypothetical protein
MRSIRVLATNMPPEVPIAALAFHWFPRLSLLLADLLEVTIAVLIEAVVPAKDAFPNDALLPNGDDREDFYIQVHGHRHKVRIPLALNDLFCLDLFGLGEMDLG